MKRKMLGVMALVSVALMSASGLLLAQADAPKYQEGVHFEAIEGAPVRTDDGVEVVEAFSYMCTHCATFEPYITSWKQRKPEAVTFKRIPVVFGRSSWELYARAYVTAEMMGIADKAHGELMDKIWKEREIMRDMDELAAFYAGFGVDADTFLATSKSFAVDAKMRKDQRSLQTAGVRGTPSLVVEGKYLVAGNEAVANYDVMLDVVDFLANRELAAKASRSAAQAPAEGGDAED